jgi:S1-C subfamily serine protease
MKRITFFLIAVGLIALGVFADRLLSPSNSQPVLAATSTSSSPTVNLSNASANISSAAIDAATENAYAVAGRSVVYVNSTGTGTGSGIIYDSNGDIVTNLHVVTGASKITVTLSNGHTYGATLVGTDTADDLAVIHISAGGLTPAQFASAGSYHVAQMVLAIGSPLGLQGSVTSGLISGLNRVEQEPNGAYLSSALQTSAPINPGNSGGALVTLNGTVVGMPTLVQTSSTDGTSTQNIGFAIPSQRIVFIANQLIASGKVTHTGRPYLGIAPTDGNTNSSPYQGFFGQGGQGSTSSTVNGAYVQQLAANGPAAQAGVQQGDVVTSVNGTTVTSAQDLLTALAQHKPGDTISLTLNRNGSTLTVQVHLGQLPASS